MYKPVPGIVNEEIIKDLLAICNEHFIDAFIKLYAGANSECLFCGTTCNHAPYCPVVKYEELAKKHKRLIEK